MADIVEATKAKHDERTCAWGAFKGDRAAVWAYEGRTYVALHRGNVKLFIELGRDEDLFLAALLVKTHKLAALREVSREPAWAPRE